MKTDELDKIWTTMFNPSTPLGAGARAIIAIVLAWLIGRAVNLAIHRALDRAQRDGADPTGIRFLGKLAKLLIYVAVFVCYAHLIPELRSLGQSLLAGVGIASVVVGLAAQSTLGNVIAGISLILYRPFKIGDRLQVSAPTGLETGMVINIDLGYTVLRTADQRLLVMPNSNVASQASINLSSQPMSAPCGISVTIAVGGNSAKARQALLDLAKAHPKIKQVDGCYVTGVTSGGVVLTLVAFAADGDAVPGVKSDLLEGVHKQFEAAGIKLA